LFVNKLECLNLKKIYLKLNKNVRILKFAGNYDRT